MKKTFKVKNLLTKVNRMNKISSCSSAVRDGWNSLLETVLHQSGCYSGYNYYTQEDLGKEIVPGIAWQNIDTKVYSYTRPNDIIDTPDKYKVCFPDESRRFYYVDPKLT